MTDKRRCFDCEHEIEGDDDAAVCIPCGGRNRRVVRVYYITRLDEVMILLGIIFSMAFGVWVGVNLP